MTKLVPILLFALVLSADSSDSKSAKEVLAAMDAYKEAMIHKDGAPRTGFWRTILLTLTPAAKLSQ